MILLADGKPGDDLYDYIDAILNPLVPSAPVDSSQAGFRAPETIAHDQSMVPVWTSVSTPERALVVLFFLLGLARLLPKGRLKDAILQACGGAVRILVNHKHSAGPGMIIAQASLRM